MTARIGEYAAEAYKKLPPPPDILANGKSFDASTLIWIDSNISGLIQESPRHLVANPGPGNAEVFGGAGEPFDNIDDFGPPPSSMSFTPAHMEIPWERRTAARFGPFPIVCDEAHATTGEAIPRKVKVSVHTTYSTPDLDLYCALTIQPETRRIYEGEFLAFDTVACSGTGRYEFTLEPDVRVPRSLAEWACRRVTSTSESVGAIVPLVPLYVWVGWRPVDVGAGVASIDSISIFETR
jgi:hypothetical protein